MNNKLYVAMTDNFMSGWGMAEGKINKYVIACDNQQQADQIEAAAKKKIRNEIYNHLYRASKLRPVRISGIHEALQRPRGRVDRGKI